MRPASSLASSSHTLECLCYCCLSVCQRATWQDSEHQRPAATEAHTGLQLSFAAQIACCLDAVAAPLFVILFLRRQLTALDVGYNELTVVPAELRLLHRLDRFVAVANPLYDEDSLAETVSHKVPFAIFVPDSAAADGHQHILPG